MNLLYSISMPIFKNARRNFYIDRKNGDPKFTSRFRKKVFQSMLIQFWNLPTPDKIPGLSDGIYLSAMVGLMTKWYENGNNLTDDEF